MIDTNRSEVKAIEFLRAFRGDDTEPVHIRLLPPKGVKGREVDWDVNIERLATDKIFQADLVKRNRFSGVYFCPNVGGRDDPSITRYTAAFCERDTLSIPEQHALLDAAPIQPSIRVETKKRVHAYWLLDGGGPTEAEWRLVQERLIAYFDSDPEIKNPSRLMRLPGFEHIHVKHLVDSLNDDDDELAKAMLEPANRKRVVVHTFEPRRRYTVAALNEAFGVTEPKTAEQGARQKTDTERGEETVEFEFHEDRHAELCLRIVARGKLNSRGHYDAQCLAHSGTGKTSLAYFPEDESLTTGAVTCNAGCDYFAILAAEGLPVERLKQRVIPKQKEKKEKPKVAATTPVEPWLELVDLAEVLNEIAMTVRRFVVMEPEAADTVALWTQHTYVFDVFDLSPYLYVNSPVLQCGKSTMLEVLSGLVAKPRMMMNVSPPALFRLIEAERPTLLFDELEGLLKDNEELRGMFNAGYRRDGKVARCEGKDFSVRDFSVYCPKAIAQIKGLPDTTVSRCITIKLQRALPGERRERWRHAYLRTFEDIRRRAIRWSDDHRGRLAELDPAIPETVLNDRMCDNWRPPLCIADLAGGDWPERARRAMVALCNVETNSEQHGIMLLADLWQAFDALGENLETTQIIKWLCDLEDRPWSEYGRTGKPISTNHWRSYSDRLVSNQNIGEKTRRLLADTVFHLLSLFLLDTSPPS